MTRTPNPSAGRRRLAFALAVTVLLALPVAFATAAHWPNYGGDPGHSGNQPIFEASMGVESNWHEQDAGSIRTSLLMSGGGDPDRVISYGRFIDVAGTADDQTRIFVRKVEDGELVASPQIDDDTSGDGDAKDSDDVTLSAGDRFVTPVSSSTDAGLGQLYVIHNDANQPAAAANGCPATTATSASTNDISIAQIDESDGTIVKDFAVGRARGGADQAEQQVCPAVDQPTADFQIESSPVLTPPLDASGRRVLFFTARKLDASGSVIGTRLFRINIENAGAKESVMDVTAPQYRDITNLNTKVSPTIGYFRDPVRDRVIPYVFVAVNASTGSADIRGYKVDDILPGETVLQVPNDVAGHPAAISIPVTQSGLMAGESGSGASQAPALYATYHNDQGTGDPLDDTTTLRKFKQVGLEPTLTEVSEGTPTPAEGIPGPGFAIGSVVISGKETNGRVAVTTNRNLILFSSETLTPVERFRDINATPPESLLEPGTSGFRRNAPLTSGGFIFVQSDEGAQFVLRMSDAERVPEEQFTEDLSNNTSDFGFAQSAYSRAALAYMSDRGLFMYRTGFIPPPNDEPIPSFTITPNPATAGQTVSFDATASSDPDGSIASFEWDLDGNGSFETNTGATPTTSRQYTAAGTYSVKLRVTDNKGATETIAKDLIVGAAPQNQPPIAVFTASPQFAQTGQTVTLDASASRDPDGTIVRYEWDFDGNGVYDQATTTPTTTRRYSTAGVFNARLRVTDNVGARAEAIRQVTVARAARVRPGISAKVTPTRDRTLPYVFKTTGTVRPPRPLSRSLACNGRVTVSIKAGKKTISRRTSRLSRTCTFRQSVTFRDRKRIGRTNRLRFTVRFQGNTYLTARSARTITRRAG